MMHSVGAVSATVILPRARTPPASPMTSSDASDAIRLPQSAAAQSWLAAIATDVDQPSSWGIWWSQAGSNRRPRECHSRALPTELWPLQTNQKPEIGWLAPALELAKLFF